MSRLNKYTKSDLMKAIKLAKNTTQSIRGISRKMKIPEATIRNHIKGRSVKYGKGNDFALDNETEEQLVTFVKFMSDRCRPLSRKAFGAIVGGVVRKLKSSGKKIPMKDQGPSGKWIRNFMKRHSITLKNSKSVSRSKALANTDVIDDYFRKLKEAFEQRRYSKKAIWNVDESGFSEDQQNSRKVMGMSGRTHIYELKLYTGEHTTVETCTNAAGDLMPAMVVYKKTIPQKSCIPVSWDERASVSGFMNTGLFELWFTEIFLKNCGKERPQLLIMDNASIHFSPFLMNLSREHDIDILFLPSNTSHILQPNDQMFGLLKGCMFQELQGLGYITDTTIVRKAQFGVLLKHAYQNALINSKEYTVRMEKSWSFSTDQKCH